MLEIHIYLSFSRALRYTVVLKAPSTLNVQFPLTCIYLMDNMYWFLSTKRLFWNVTSFPKHFLAVESWCSFCNHTQFMFNWTHCEWCASNFHRVPVSHTACSVCIFREQFSLSVLHSLETYFIYQRLWAHDSKQEFAVNASIAVLQSVCESFSSIPQIHFSVALYL